jgi:hypothetical protein
MVDAKFLAALVITLLSMGARQYSFLSQILLGDEAFMKLRVYTLAHLKHL